MRTVDGDSCLKEKELGTQDKRQETCLLSSLTTCFSSGQLLLFTLLVEPPRQLSIFQPILTENKTKEISCYIHQMRLKAFILIQTQKQNRNK